MAALNFAFWHKIMSFTLPSLFFANHVLSSPHLRGRATILKPTDDSFYIPKLGFEATAAGTILASREVPVDLAAWSVAPLNVQSAHQLLYRTADSLGNPQASVTTIIVPYNADVTKLLSFQMAEDSPSRNCAPSYILQAGSGVLNGGSALIEIVQIIAALNQGWIVNFPDYQGPDAAFTDGIQSGQATLDSVRAALDSGHITGVSSSATYQMWGYSGGSIATEWAAELAPTYAPELSFAGMAVGGLVPDLESALFATTGTFFAGLSAGAVRGLLQAYPHLQYIWDEEIVPEKNAALAEASNLCLSDIILEYAFQDMFSYFTRREGVLQRSEIQSVLNTTGIMGKHGVPEMPVYAYKAIGDEISPVKDTDVLVEKLCSLGADIQYLRDSVGEHATMQVQGAAGAIQFLRDRFDGKPAQRGCSVTNVTFDLSSSAAEEYFGATASELMSVILGNPLGIGN